MRQIHNILWTCKSDIILLIINILDVFQYYATGVIHRPSEVCPASFLSELDFWRISHQHVGSCCADIVPREKQEEKEEEQVMKRREGLLENVQA